jgi:hypothetical protein
VNAFLDPDVSTNFSQTTLGVLTIDSPTRASLPFSVIDHSFRFNPSFSIFVGNYASPVNFLEFSGRLNSFNLCGPQLIHFLFKHRLDCLHLIMKERSFWIPDPIILIANIKNTKHTVFTRGKQQCDIKRNYHSGYRSDMTTQNRKITSNPQVVSNHSAIFCTKNSIGPLFAITNCGCLV